ncbi:palmitoyltransferase [Malassezia yamatoensis]|uniref:Palmitoyltransferase n=1 Tax=Malassezia yamatoensis TaxID=253288 RepID=A0AAJ5YXN0_9BASI|nr:palmitoyltransferase [Malassezia yamatoensis]
MAFMAKTVAERTSPTQRQSISENQFTAHVHARPAVDGVSGVLISDSEYPVRVAFSLVNKLLDEFMIKVAKSSWQTQANNLALSGNVPSKGEGILKQSEFPQAQEYLVRYQDPRQADTILRVQQELDDTKIVLHNTIDSVLQRGEDLDKLVEKSGSLSQQSKMFYKSARKQIGIYAFFPTMVDLGSKSMLPSTYPELESDPDTLFARLSVRDVQQYYANLQQIAAAKKSAADALVGDQYEEFLRVASSVLRMQYSLGSVRQTFNSLSLGVTQLKPLSVCAPADLGKDAVSLDSARIALASARLLREAPAMATTALHQGALLHAAWALSMGRTSHSILMQSAYASELISEAKEQLAELNRLQKFLCQTTLSHIVSDEIGDSLTICMVWLILNEKSPQECLTEIFSQSESQLENLLHAESHAPIAIWLSEIVTKFHKTLDRVYTIFAPRNNRRSALETAIDALAVTNPTSRFYQLGSQLLARRFGNIDSLLPEAIRFQTPGQFDYPTEKHLNDACQDWSQRICSQIDRLTGLVMHVDDLDTITACEMAVQQASIPTSESNHSHSCLEMLRTHFKHLLHARARYLVEQSHQQTVSQFQQTLQKGLADVSALETAPLFPPTPMCWDACTLVQTYLLRAVRHITMYGDAAIAPLSHACDEFFSQLEQEEPNDTFSLIYLCRIAAGFRSDILPIIHESLPYFEQRQEEVEGKLLQRWSEHVVQNAVAASQAALQAEAQAATQTPTSKQSSAQENNSIPTHTISVPLQVALESLCLEHLRYAPPTCNLLQEFAKRYQVQNPFDLEFLQHLTNERPSSNQLIHQEIRRLRLALAPYTFLCVSASSTETESSPRSIAQSTARIALIAPRITSL